MVAAHRCRWEGRTLLAHGVTAALLVSCCFVSVSRTQAQYAGDEFYDQGLDLSKAKRYREAIPYYTRAIQMDERNADAYAERAYAWVQLEDYDNALADANEAIRLNPNGEIAYCQRGRVWLVKEDYDRAVADFNQAIRLYPTDSGYYYNRGLAWEGKRSYDRAITDFGEAIRLNPNDVDVYSELAWIQATCPDAQYRDGQKAFENASRAYQLDGGKHWRSLNALAAAYAENGDFAAARNWQAKAIELAPNGTFKIKDKCRYRLEFYNKGEPFRTTK